MNNQLTHISFIMDGNNRWSKKNNKDFKESYLKGAKKLLDISEFIFTKYDVSNISAFALSKQNLKRSKSTIKILKSILYKYLLEISNKDLKFNLRFIGDFSIFDKKTKSLIETFEEKRIKKKNLFIFLNYSGKDEIINASCDYKKNIDSKFEKFLLTKDIPDPEILVRTGGFSRISDFMLYQISFTELFFLKKLWPDLKNRDIEVIISKYQKLERKFGR